MQSDYQNFVLVLIHRKHKVPPPLHSIRGLRNAPLLRPHALLALTGARSALTRPWRSHGMAKVWVVLVGTVLSKMIQLESSRPNSNSDSQASQFCDSHFRTHFLTEAAHATFAQGLRPRCPGQSPVPGRAHNVIADRRGQSQCRAITEKRLGATRECEHPDQ